MVLDMIDQMVTQIVEESVPEKISDEFDPKPLEERALAAFNMPFAYADVPAEKRTQDGLGGFLYERVATHYDEREVANGPEVMRRIETILLLQTLDTLWKDHLLSMDHLREGIGLRGYGQKDPLLEYKKEGFLLFRNMMNQFVADTVQKLFRVQVSTEESVARAAAATRMRAPVQAQHQEQSAFDARAPEEARGDFGRRQETVKRTVPKVGRNEPCPCGSGKKYKKCHGA
jgi:preprotein translocase subunit SecA